MDNVKQKLEPKYKEACLKLGELWFQKQTVDSQIQRLNAQIDDQLFILKSLEGLYLTFQEFEAELAKKYESNASD